MKKYSILLVLLLIIGCNKNNPVTPANSNNDDFSKLVGSYTAYRRGSDQMPINIGVYNIIYKNNLLNESYYGHNWTFVKQDTGKGYGNTKNIYITFASSDGDNPYGKKMLIRIENFGFDYLYIIFDDDDPDELQFNRIK